MNNLAFLLHCRQSVSRTMTKLKLLPFTREEEDYLKEYILVMRPIAAALDKLQAEEQAYLGCMLPILALTVLSLREARDNNLQFCLPLVEVLQWSIERRYGPLFEDTEYLLAAAFHPRFFIIRLNLLCKTVKLDGLLNIQLFTSPFELVLVILN